MIITLAILMYRVINGIDHNLNLEKKVDEKISNMTH